MFRPLPSAVVPGRAGSVPCPFQAVRLPCLLVRVTLTYKKSVGRLVMGAFGMGKGNGMGVVG